MKVDVKLSPLAAEARTHLDATVIVVDVLRASTTIITALANGARNVVPVLTPDEAATLKLRYDSANVLLGGERGGVKIQGFDLGNSPLEYTEETVSGKTIVFTSTNGTEAIKDYQRSNGANRCIELEAVARFMVELGKDDHYAQEPRQLCFGRCSLCRSFLHGHIQADFGGRVG